MRADRRWRTRKEKKEWARRLQSNDPGLDVIHLQAAGIDVGNASHYVAVRPDRDLEPVRQFGCFTADLHRLADWLKSCGVNRRDPLEDLHHPMLRPHRRERQLHRRRAASRAARIPVSIAPCTVPHAPAKCVASPAKCKGPIAFARSRCAGIAPTGTQL